MASTNKSGSEPEPETSVVPGPTQNVSPSDTSFKSGLAQMKQRLRDLGIPDATQDKMEAEVPGSVKKIYDSMQAKPNPLSPTTSTRKERADALARAMGFSEDDESDTESQQKFDGLDSKPTVSKLTLPERSVHMSAVANINTESRIITDRRTLPVIHQVYEKCGGSEMLTNKLLDSDLITAILPDLLLHVHSDHIGPHGLLSPAVHEIQSQVVNNVREFCESLILNDLSTGIESHFSDSETLTPNTDPEYVSIFLEVLKDISSLYQRIARTEITRDQLWRKEHDLACKLQDISAGIPLDTAHDTVTATLDPIQNQTEAVQKQIKSCKDILDSCRSQIMMIFQKRYLMSDPSGRKEVTVKIDCIKIDDKLRIGDGNANDPKLADRLISDVRFVLFSNPQQFDALIPVFEMAMEVAKDQFAYNWWSR